ncbi:MAG: MFS transporter [Candidatus Nanopelagicales bacterium]|jgi:DHA2 family multidrug resistance protein-like MFS transporter
MSPNSWMTNGEGHPRRWAILGVLVVSLLIVVLDNTVLNIALPTIQRDLGASAGELVWAIDSYILAFAALLFTWGALGDRYGRKRILVIGLIIFGIASAASAFAETPAQLIAFRAVMGVGGAAVMPTTLAIITVVFPPHERGKAIGAWAGAVGAAVALGPVLGGLLLQNPQWSSWITGNDWGAVFLINVPIVILGLIGVWRIVPESRDPNPRRLDLIGLALSVVGLTLLIYGIIHASSTLSWTDPGVVLPMLAGIAVIGLFLWYEARSDHKSFDVSLFANRGYAISLSAVTLAFFALSGITFTLPFYLQILRGYDTLTAGLCFVPFAVGQILAAPRSAGMVLKFGYRAVMTTGLVLVALSLIGLFFVGMTTPIWVVLIVFFVFGFGMGNVIAPASTVMQNVLPLARAGAGSAVQNTVRQVGGALGVAIIGTVLATQYASRVAISLQGLPDQVPDDARRAAENSIVATDALLSGLEQSGAPATILESVRQSAYDAFLSSAHVTYLVSITVVLIATALVAFALPLITPPRKGVAVPADSPIDERIREEEQDYPEQLAGEVADDRGQG